MYDILSAILHHENMGLWDEAVTAPDPGEEQRIHALLNGLDPQILTQITREVKRIAASRYDDGFLRGVRFGAQLMLQLADSF